jgi:hypothetical protein
LIVAPGVVQVTVTGCSVGYHPPFEVKVGVATWAKTALVTLRKTVPNIAAIFSRKALRITNPLEVRISQKRSVIEHVCRTLSDTTRDK